MWQDLYHFDLVTVAIATVLFIISWVAARGRNVAP